MKKSPISVKKIFYRGSDVKKRTKAAQFNCAALELEKAINTILSKQVCPVQSYTYQEIASLTGYPYDLVRDLCFSVDAGHNGFTIIRSDLSFEDAMQHIHINHGEDR